jgi:hypothetical protein
MHHIVCPIRHGVTLQRSHWTRHALAYANASQASVRSCALAAQITFRIVLLSVHAHCGIQYESSIGFSVRPSDPAQLITTRSRSGQPWNHSIGAKEHIYDRFDVQHGLLFVLTFTPSIEPPHTTDILISPCQDPETCRPSPPRSSLGFSSRTSSEPRFDILQRAPISPARLRSLLAATRVSLHVRLCWRPAVESVRSQWVLTNIDRAWV